MTKRTNNTVTKQDIADLVSIILDAVKPASTPAGYIITKIQNTSSQYFFSDHEPVDGIDSFGHSTKDISRMVREAYKYATFTDALQSLVELCHDDYLELVNNTIKALGIYSVADEKFVFTMDLNHDDAVDQLMAMDV